MSPTVFRYKGYRFFFFSREEERMHIHVYSGHGEAKFWLAPIVSLAQNYGLSEREINDLKKVIEEKKDELAISWNNYFAKNRDS